MTPHHRGLAGALTVLTFVSFTASAQEITTGPEASVSIPVDNPWALGLLLLAFTVCAYVVLQRRTHRVALAGLLSLGLAAGMLWQSPDLRAQVVLMFTNPAGETLPIAVHPVTSNGDIEGFEPADFVNNSGNTLRITGIELPTFARCFPDGAGNLLPPGQPDPDPPASCGVGQTLPNGATCRVDVEGICRDLAAANVTLTAISPNSGPAAGGAGVTLTGTGLAGATAVSFDGVAATGVNVVNSTTVTAVTPAHAAGTVDVVIDTPAGGATLTNGYTYLATAVGQSSGGGTIACLNGGLNNLIAATADNSTAIEWGGFGTAIGSGAQSVTDGAANTAAIVAGLGNNGGTPYAAQLCTDYEVDSQGNTPCQAGNTCYNDWFLPAGNNVTVTGQLNCLFANRAAIGGFAAGFYWSSTEFSGDPVSGAWMQDFNNGSQFTGTKSFAHRVRCVRGFTP